VKREGGKRIGKRGREEKREGTSPATSYFSLSPTERKEEKKKKERKRSRIYHPPTSRKKRKKKGRSKKKGGGRPHSLFSCPSDRQAREGKMKREGIGKKGR